QGPRHRPVDGACRSGLCLRPGLRVEPARPVVLLEPQRGRGRRRPAPGDLRMASTTATGYEPILGSMASGPVPISRPRPGRLGDLIEQGGLIRDRLAFVPELRSEALPSQAKIMAHFGATCFKRQSSSLTLAYPGTSIPGVFERPPAREQLFLDAPRPGDRSDAARRSKPFARGDMAKSLRADLRPCRLTAAG